MKTCVEPGCTYPVFSRGFCPIHWKRYFGKAIKKRTKKRSVQEIEYGNNRADFIGNSRDEYGWIYCVFCGEKIRTEPSLHHALGRDDEMLLEEKYWMLSHNKCHVEEYHSKSWKDITWWGDYLIRLKSYPIEVLEKELKRMEK